MSIDPRSGEHCVGYGKAEFLAAEPGEAHNVMAALKKTLGPQGIMNPGKMRWRSGSRANERR